MFAQNLTDLSHGKPPESENPRERGDGYLPGEAGFRKYESSFWYDNSFEMKSLRRMKSRSLEHSSGARDVWVWLEKRRMSTRMAQV